MRLSLGFEVESRLAVPLDLAMGPGKSIIEDYSAPIVETAVLVGPGSPEVATVVKFLDICGIITRSVIIVYANPLIRTGSLT